MRVKGNAVRFLILMVCTGFLFCAACLADGREAVQNKRVAVFFDKDFPTDSSPRSISWYRSSLKELRLDVTVANAKEISDTKFLTKKRFDTLILPSGCAGKNIPFEANYSIPNFLAEGGNVITATLPHHYYTWCQLRPYRDAGDFQKRSLNHTLKANQNLPAYLLEKLPSTAGPVNKTINVLEKMMFGYSCLKNQINVPLAANILLPVYTLPDRKSTDFIAYRYHNTYFNGPTMIHLGETGSSLLNTDAAGNVLYACLKLCEIRFPDEQEPSYYERLIKLNKEISAFGRLFIETYYPLRDITFYSFYKGEREKFENRKEAMIFCEGALLYVMTEKQAIDRLLVSGKDIEDQDKRRKNLLTMLNSESEKFRNIKKKIAGNLQQIKYPKHVGIKNNFIKEFVVEAGTADPLSLYMLRKDFFQTIKELGGNVWTKREWGWPRVFRYLNDPVVKENRKGIKFSVYNIRSWNLLEIKPIKQGSFDPITGQIIDAKKRQVYDYERLEKIIRDSTFMWKDMPVWRFWHAGERVLDNRFWGDQAREEYQEHLKKKYKDIETLNARWKAEYARFDEIKLLTSKPESISEHSNWEDWISFREERIIAVLQYAYNLYKKYAPGIPAIPLCSAANAIRQPFGAANYYQLTKPADINGMDDTGGSASREWLSFDLNCGKPVCTVEWSTFYRPPSDIFEGRRKLSHQIWQQVSAGEVGINCWLWRWSGFPGNYVDCTGLPTLYGWELKNLVSDFKTFDHIFLDGKRKEPQVRILYSDSCRCHQQEFVLGSCIHLDAVTNLYSFFLDLHIPARVIAEDAILDGFDLSNYRLVIVPHAEYLSEKTQNMLLNYVKKGGNILLEGESGKFDNYGHPKNLLYKKACATPSTTKRRKISLGSGKTVEIRDAFSPLLFSPEKAKVLLSYEDGEPAVVSVPTGKGRIIISGVKTSLITEEINKEINLLPRFICSDKRILVRDWEYNGEDYLICAYPQGEKPINEFLLKIKGKYRVIDYLLGVEVPSEFDGRYTSFSGIVTSPGGRVYNLKKR